MCAPFPPAKGHSTGVFIIIEQTSSERNSREFKLCIFACCVFAQLFEVDCFAVDAVTQAQMNSDRRVAAPKKNSNGSSGRDTWKQSRNVQLKFSYVARDAVDDDEVEERGEPEKKTLFFCCCLIVGRQKVRVRANNSMGLKVFFCCCLFEEIKKRFRFFNRVSGLNFPPHAPTLVVVSLREKNTEKTSRSSESREHGRDLFPLRVSSSSSRYGCEFREIRCWGRILSHAILNYCGETSSDNRKIISLRDSLAQCVFQIKF